LNLHDQDALRQDCFSESSTARGRIERREEEHEEQECQWTPEEATSILDKRASQLRESLARIERDLAWNQSGRQPPRITRLETKYPRAITSAELNWVDGILDDLRTGALTWKHDELAETAQSFLPD
jgi:hypothetical protein